MRQLLTRVKQGRRDIACLRPVGHVVINGLVDVGESVAVAHLAGEGKQRIPKSGKGAREGFGFSLGPRSGPPVSWASCFPKQLAVGLAGSRHKCRRLRPTAWAQSLSAPRTRKASRKPALTARSAPVIFEQVEVGVPRCESVEGFGTYFVLCHLGQLGQRRRDPKSEDLATRAAWIVS